MANICDCELRVHSESVESLKGFYETIHNLEKESRWDVRLCDLLTAYGIDYEKEHIPVRGNIYYSELDEENLVMSLGVETAWCPMDEAFDAINEKLGGCFVISRRAVECGCEVFSVKDSMGDFPEECLVSASGEPWEEGFEQPFETIEKAVDFWCKKMQVKREGRSDEEMLELIEGFEYANEDCYFYVHPFEFE